MAQDLTTHVKDYVKVDDELKTSRTMLKPLRDRKLELSDKIIQSMQSSNLRVVRLTSDKCELSIHERLVEQKSGLRTKIQDAIKKQLPDLDADTLQSILADVCPVEKPKTVVSLRRKKTN